MSSSDAYIRETSTHPRPEARDERWRCPTASCGISRSGRPCPSVEPTAWLFPSENLTTPFSRENCRQRNLGPRLKANGLGWVNFQVMRRTHSSLMWELEVDPKVTADQLGHSVDVNQNVYTQTNLNRRLEAVRRLENACLAADAA